jgi:hypothetical protein
MEYWQVIRVIVEHLDYGMPETNCCRKYAVCVAQYRQAAPYIMADVSQLPIDTLYSIELHKYVEILFADHLSILKIRWQM